MQYQGTGNALSQMTFGNRTIQNFVMNDRLQMESQELKRGAEVLQKYTYGYGQINTETGVIAANSNNGQLAKIESTIGTAKQWEQRFGYDSIGRLSEAREHRGDTNALSYKQKFDYDRFGNLYRKASSNPTTGQATPIAFAPIEDADISKSTNQFTSGTTYDDAGNVTQDAKFRNLNYSYDANGRMYRTSSISQPNQSNAVYDSAGQRVATQVDGVWTFFIYDGSGKKIAEYGGLQATDEGGVKYVLQDYQGSSRAILSNSGFVNARMDYTAFGEEIQTNIGQRTAQGYGASNTLDQKYALTERDKATGLDHTWFRKLENQAGRWTSPDPYNGSMSLGNPQSFNRYSYVENQPTNFVDPSGLQLSSGCYVYTEGIKYPDGSVVITYQIRFCIGGGSGGGGGGFGFGGGGAGGGSGTAQTEGCGVNPITNKPYIYNEKPDPKTGLREGGLGNIRPGNGGRGGFRERTGGGHTATDIVAPVGTSTVANRSGVVAVAISGYKPANTSEARDAQAGGLGNVVIIDHGDGIYTLYAHLTDVFVKAGDSVGQGQLIGTSGRTGNANNSDQPAEDDHLHFGVFTGKVKKNGFPVEKSQYKNPAHYLNSPCSNTR